MKKHTSTAKDKALTPGETHLLRLREKATAAGMQCLAISWHGQSEQYEFRCNKGHTFTVTASHVIYHSIRCRACFDEQRLQRLHQIAQQKGGKCLESTYLGDVPHRFSCAHGHEWRLRPDRINTSWCRRCAAMAHGQKILRKDGMAELHRIATEKGGRCLSDIYTGTNVYYQFVCAQGHQWQTSGNEIFRGVWCRPCASDKKRTSYLLTDGMERLHQAAKEKGGECLAEEYRGAGKHYRFRCQHGHEWETTGQKIMRGAWCGVCVYDSKRLGIDAMRQIAQERGGLCLSEEYVNNMTKLHWECDRGHRWYAMPGSVKQGHWCAQCSAIARTHRPKSKARLKYETHHRSDAIGDVDTLPKRKAQQPIEE